MTVSMRRCGRDTVGFLAFQPAGTQFPALQAARYHFMCLLISFLHFYKQARSLEPMLVTHSSFPLRFHHVQVKFMNLLLMDFYSWVFPNLHPCKQFCNEYREGNVIFMNIIWCFSVRRVKGDKGPWRGVVAGTGRPSCNAEPAPCSLHLSIQPFHSAHWQTEVMKGSSALWSLSLAWRLSQSRKPWGSQCWSWST